METAVIKPTIGRRIWYWPIGVENHDSLDAAQPFDAGVVFVQDDTRVSLDICAHNGNRFFNSAVEITDQAVPGCAQWMPYQVTSNQRAAA